VGSNPTVRIDTEMQLIHVTFDMRDMPLTDRRVLAGPSRITLLVCAVRAVQMPAAGDLEPDLEVHHKDVVVDLCNAALGS
jgi:hypothetical protein